MSDFNPIKIMLDELKAADEKRICIMAWQANYEAILPPPSDISTDDPAHWSHQGSNYSGNDCINCGRNRVLQYGNGREICEKCNWDQQTDDYAMDHDRIG